MGKVKEIQCFACDAWHSVTEWDNKKYNDTGRALSVEREGDRVARTFQCPSCGVHNDMEMQYKFAVRYRHSLHGMDKVDVITEYHPAQVAADMKLVNILIEEATQQWERRQEIEEAIDRALDQRDEETFYKLAKNLTEATA